jgi:hypothetical protein
MSAPATLRMRLGTVAARCTRSRTVHARAAHPARQMCVLPTLSQVRCGNGHPRMAYGTRAPNPGSTRRTSGPRRPARHADGRWQVQSQGRRGRLLSWSAAGRQQRAPSRREQRHRKRFERASLGGGGGGTGRLRLTGPSLRSLVVSIAAQYRLPVRTAARLPAVHGSDDTALDPAPPPAERPTHQRHRYAWPRRLRGLGRTATASARTGSAYPGHY